MQVILTQQIEALGVAGDVVTVKPGYARNYLLPKGLAVPATKGSLKHYEHLKKSILARHDKAVTDAEGQATAFDGVVLEFLRRAGSEGKLFGSVTSMDIQRELAEKGYEIDRRRISLGGPIKALGDHEVSIKMGFGVTATVGVTVVREGEVDETEVLMDGRTVAEVEAEAAALEAARRGDRDEDEGEDRRSLAEAASAGPPAEAAPSGESPADETSTGETAGGEPATETAETTD